MEAVTRRKSKSDNYRVYVATSFPSHTFLEIEKLAKQFDFRNAQVVRALVLRGLEAYGRDGVLYEQQNAEIVVPRRHPDLHAIRVES
jgi:5-formaminoimidazole-4-carboxamide-1-beta-D-ribofuranosyl 5'-monophosphate synthetase